MPALVLPLVHLFSLAGKLDGPQCFLLLLHILNSFDYLGRLLHIHKFEGFPLNSRHRKPQLFLDFLCVLLDIKERLNIPTCLLPCFIPAKNLCRLVSTQKRVSIFSLVFDTKDSAYIALFTLWKSGSKRVIKCTSSSISPMQCQICLTFQWLKGKCSLFCFHPGECMRKCIWIGKGHDKAYQKSEQQPSRQQFRDIFWCYSEVAFWVVSIRIALFALHCSPHSWIPTIKRGPPCPGISQAIAWHFTKEH